MDRDKRQPEFKVIVIGSQGVGKTCITERYCVKKFTPNVSSTIGSSYLTTRLFVDDVQVKLHIWDTAGQEKFRSMTPIYYRNTNAALICFDLTSEETFMDCDLWLRDLQKHLGNCILCLVGNKCDLVEQRQVTSKRAARLADQMNAHYFETSAKSDIGVCELFHFCALQLVEEQKALPVYRFCSKSDDDQVQVQESFVRSHKSRCC